MELDPATDTVRVAGNLDGTLTGPASGAAAPIGLRYVRAHRGRLGLTTADLDTLAEPTVRSAGGIRQVRWRQEVDGIAVADAELRVNVDAEGRVINVLGSPSSSLPQDTSPLLAEPEPDAELTIYSDRLAYRYRDEAGPDAIYDTISDADTGKVLKRTNLVKRVDIQVWENHPSLSVPATVFTVPADWLTSTTRLESRWMRVYADLSSGDREVAPRVYEFEAFPGTKCTSEHPCSRSGSQTTNTVDRNAVQAFHLANRFREHLRTAPIDFDGFQDADRLLVETSDFGVPNNANMYTPPEGESPRMQLGLWSGPAYRSVNSGDDASILFHEYTHGLSGRLVVDADGVQALGSWQAGAMGEGWSDYYAKDYLVQKGLETDGPETGEIDMGAYMDSAAHSTRNAGLDCPVGSTCPDGGYTYGDFAAGGPEFHDDGEIWAQTLWDLRTAMAAPNDTLAIVTQAMRLSPPEPSFLDMRNAILQADSALFSSAHHAAIWSVFAERGMGWDASTVDGADTQPVEGIALPPAGGPVGTLSGAVTDGGTPIVGATVSIGVRTATTDADGNYALANLPAQTYAHAVITAPGYDRAVLDDVAVPGEADAQLRRNWASVRGGATATSPTGNENAPIGCGPKQAVDGETASTWSTQFGGEKPLVVKLPQPIDITSLAIDPTAGCGDGVGSSMADYTVKVAANAAGPWTQIATGTFTAAHRGKLNAVAATASDATYVQLTPMTTQTAGASYIDVSEFSVYGVPHEPAPVTTIVTGPQDIESDATPSFTFSSDQPGGTFRCRLVGGPLTTCTSPYTTAPLTNGQTYTFEVYAVNVHGTADATPVTRTFTIHSELPTTTLGEKPAAVTNAASVRFTFTGNGSSFECSRDGTAFTACTSPENWTPREGTHTFAVRARNSLGPDPSPETHTFTVDTTAPETIIAWAPPPILTAREFSLAFTASEAATFVCSVDGAAAAPCASPLQLTGLGEGAHSVVVTATDTAGNVDPTPARSDFTVIIPALPPAPRPTATPAPAPAPKSALTSATVVKTASLKTLRKTGKLKITLRSASGAKVTVQAKVGSRVLGTATRIRSGAFQLTLSKSRLRGAKAGSSVVVRLRASGNGLKAVTQTLRVRLKV